MQAMGETLFDAVYLVTVIAIGIKMIKENKTDTEYFLFGVMALVLGLGDSFHLIPRATALCTKGLESFTAALGIGKYITSVTMTVFYILLYYVWRKRYKIKDRANLTAGIYALAAIRILLCIMPQNGWTTANPSLAWGIYRNIPFLLMGIIIIMLFYKSSKSTKDEEYKYMWLTIALSFGFYIPVVLFAERLPMIGALMIPKTCAYVWTILIGYKASLNKKGEKDEKAY